MKHTKMKKFIVITGHSSGVSMEIVFSKNLSSLKARIRKANDGNISFIKDLEDKSDSEYWEEGGCLIIEGNIAV